MHSRLSQCSTNEETWSLSIRCGATARQCWRLFVTSADFCATSRQCSCTVRAAISQKAGAELAIIGNGAPHYVQGFRDKTGFDGPVYTDPSRKSYRALGMRRGLRTLARLQAVRRAIQVYRDGFRQTGVQGDAWQQGGVFVVDTAGHLVYAYRSEYGGDHPPMDEVIAAARRAE